MESLVRRYFWVVNLGLLAVIAFLAARVANNVLAERIVLLPTTVQTTAEEVSARAEGPDTATWARQIAERNLFNANPPEEVDPNESQGEGGEGGDGEDGPKLPDGTPPGPNDPCKDSDAAIGLRATMMAEPAEWSMAVVTDGAEATERLARPGMVIGDVVMVAVHRNRIVLSKGADFECVEIGKVQKGAPPKGRNPALGPATPGAGTTKNDDIAKGVVKTGPDSYAVDRAMLDAQLEDLGKLTGQARVIPHYRDGKPQGFKVVGVRPGSLYSHLGVRSGDVIKAVNDDEINSPNKALELFDKLKTSNNVTVTVERRGKPVNLDYTIK